jgi:hypothetical protein
LIPDVRLELGSFAIKPMPRPLTGYDFSFQPLLDRNRIRAHRY